MSNLPTATTSQPLIPSGWQIPDALRHRLGDSVGRQRVMEAEGHLLVILHEPPAGLETTRIGRIFWRDPEGNWKPAALKHEAHPIGELLDQYAAVIGKLDEAETVALTAQQYFDVLTNLTPLVRSTHNLYSTLQDARQLVKEDRKLLLLRDRAYELSRRAELLMTDAKNTLDFTIARRAEEQAGAAERQAKASHRLNVLAAFFFPIATLTAIFGMNLQHGLEKWDAAARSPWAMAAVLGAGLVAGGILALFVTRK